MSAPSIPITGTRTVCLTRSELLEQDAVRDQRRQPVALREQGDIVTRPVKAGGVQAPTPAPKTRILMSSLTFDGRRAHGDNPQASGA